MSEVSETVKNDIKDLVVQCIACIENDHRASDEDDTPSMLLTIGYTPERGGKAESWGFQTGDNSYSGGAYGHEYWGVIALYRDSVATECMEDIVYQVNEGIACYGEEELGEWQETKQ